MKNVAIINSFAIPIRSHYNELNQVDLCYQAVKGLVKKTGIGIKDIDLLISSGSDFFDGRGISTSFIIDAMGGQLKEESKVEGDGIFAVYYAMMRLQTQRFKYALVVSYCKTSESPSFHQSISNLEPFFLRPFSLTEYSSGSLQASSYMNKSGVMEDDLSEIVIKNFENGRQNPLFELKESISMDEIQNQPYFIKPLKRFDLCPPSDGACALLLTTSENAKVRITGAGMATSPYQLGFRDISKIESARIAFKKACEHAEIQNPSTEIDIFEMDYHISVHELMLCEAFGLAGEYKGREIILSKKLMNKVNQSGGPLCGRPGIASGLYRLHEAFQKIINSENIWTGLAHGSLGMGLQTNCVLILKKS